MRQEEAFRIIRGVGGNYWIHNEENEEFQVQAPGVFRKKNHKPLAGDLVYVEETNDHLIPYRMLEILPRKNSIPRPPVVNIDLLCLIIPLAEPEADLWVLDKSLVIAHARNIPVKIIFTKEDISTDENKEMIEVYKNAGYDVAVSNPENHSLFEALRQEFEGKLIALAGPSGAGKSTMLNNIFAEELMPTQAISNKLGRGKHTTRHVELFPINAGYIADTPGFSSLDLVQAGISEEDLVKAYPEIWQEQDNCRFLTCKHLSEPSCAVKANPMIDQGRLSRYQEFRKQLEAVEDYERKIYK